MRNALVAFAVILASCAPAATPARDPLAGVYKIGGGDASIEIVTALTDAYAAKHPGVKFDIDTSLGSDPAVKLAADGSLDLGMASRELTTEEAALVDRHLIGVAGTGFAVNAQNPIKYVSTAQLVEIYTGKTVDWSMLGVQSGAIMPMVREIGSSARTTFENVAFKGKPPYGPSVLEIKGGDQMRQAIASYRGAIGIIGVSSDDPKAEGIRLVGIDGVMPTKATLMDGSYKLRRPLYLLVTRSGRPKPAVSAFIEFVNGSEGQKIIAGF